MLNSIIISMPYTKNNSRYSKNPPYNGFYSVLQHNNNYVAERTKEEKYMVKRRLKSVIAAVLVAAMLTTMAPQVVCKAAETAWEIVKNQETPLDEVYFDCKKSDDETKSYLYGYKDGKVVIMDSDYKLVKKTDYDEIAAMKEKVKGETAYIVSKKIGNNSKFGLMSEKGETVLEPQYDWMAFGNYAITVRKFSDEKYFNGLLSYDDGKELIPCEYESIKVVGVKNEKMLVTAVDYDGNYSAILDGKIIFTRRVEDKKWKYEFEFKEYNGEQCILCTYTPDSPSYGDEVLSYISYDGKMLKEMTPDEYRKNSMYPEKAYSEACNKWLNKACEDGKEHVQDFYNLNGIILNDIEVKSYYGTYEDNFGEYIKYYLVIVTGNYKENEKNKNIVYTFIYNTDGKCLLSGRSFVNLGKDNDEDESYIFMEGKSLISRYILEDSGWLCCLNDDDTVEKLFEVKSDKFTNMCANSVNSHEDYNINHDNQHYLHYDYGNIIETGNGYNRIFVYTDKKLHSYDYSYDGYYFIKNESSVGMYHCTLEKKEERELSFYNKRRYERKILWKYYGIVDIGIDELKKSSIYEVDTGLLVNDTKDRKIQFFGNNKHYTFLYTNLGITGDDKNVYVTNVCDSNEWIYFILKSGENEQYYCLNTLNGEISNVLFDDNNKSFAEKKYIEELGDKLYLYSSIDVNIVSIDKKTSITNVYKLNLDTEKEKIDGLLILDGKVYVQYVYMFDDKNYYGIMDLSGNRYISASIGKYEDKFEKYGNYIISGKDLYDSSIKNIGGEYTYVYSVSDSRIFDENGYAQLLDGVYEICCSDESFYTVKILIVDSNLEKVIYQGNGNKYLKYITKVGNYYVISIYNYDNKTTERVIIDSTTGEQLYSGDGYIYVDDINKKFVVINKRKNTPTSVPTGSAITVPTPTPTPTSEPIESTVPAPIIKPTESSVPAPTKEPTASPVTISVAKKSIKVKTGKSTKISYSAYNTKGKRVKVKAVSSNTKAAKVSVLSTSQLEITVPDNAKDGAVSKITLTNGKKKTTIKVTVQAVKNKVSKLKAKTKKVNVKKGKKSSLTYNYTAQDNKKSLTENVKISSSKKSIVKIVNKKLSNGKVTVGIKAVKKGTANITVKIGDKTATTKVVVK